MMFPLDASKIAKPFVALALSSLTALAFQYPGRADLTLYAQGSAPGIPNPSGLPTGNYRIRPGDNIRIDNLEGREFSGDHLVPPDGSLYLPMIGSVSVLGLTMQEAAEVIAAKYLRFFKYPQVGVSLLSISPIDISIAGEVNSPGTYLITLQNLREHRGIEFPTVAQAIQQFGGVTISADLGRTQVRRRQSNGEETVIALNLLNFILAGDLSQNITLRDGDTIFIPTKDEVNLLEIRQLALANFALDLSTPRTVTVLGEVTRPGSYSIKGGDSTGGDKPFPGRGDGLPTVIRALQLAGGVTSNADLRQIQIRRTAKTGRQQLFTIDIWEFLQSADVTQDTILQEGDTIFIPTAANLSQTEIREIAKASFAADPNIPRTVTVVGEVTRPGPIIVQGGDTVGINTQFGPRVEGLPTLTRVVQLVGGVTRSADIRSIQIRRRTSSDTERVINVNLWEFLQTGDLDLDPIVEEGDTIVIPTASNFNEIEARRISETSFAADPNTPRTVTVVGEVRRPGQIVVEGGDTVGINTQFGGRPEGLPTLTRSIQLAGGVTELADIRRIQLRRATKTGAERVISINLWEFLQTGDASQDPVVEQGDTIVVLRDAEVNPAEAAQLAAASFSPDTMSIYVMGEAARAEGLPQNGSIELPSATPLNQALLAAGVFNRVEANKNKVALIRLNPDGTVDQRTIEVNLSDGINEETNPLLRNNDVLVVDRTAFTKINDVSNSVASFFLASPRILTVFQLLEFLGIISR